MMPLVKITYSKAFLDSYIHRFETISPKSDVTSHLAGRQQGLTNVAYLFNVSWDFPITGAYCGGK